MKRARWAIAASMMVPAPCLAGPLAPLQDVVGNKVDVRLFREPLIADPR